MADRWDDERYRDEWERGRRYRGEGSPGDWSGGRGDWGREYGRGGDWRGDPREDRGFFERAGDEIRSWFGDEAAHRRRTRDEGEYGRPGYSGGYEPRRWGPGERYGGPERGGPGRREGRDWARQWGWMDERDVRGNPELRRWNRQEGEETGGPLEYRRPGGQGAPGRWWGGAGDPETARRGEPAYADVPRGEDWGRGESWQYSEAWLLVGPFVGRGPRDYQRSDDRLREDICERMTQHGQLDASGLEVRVQEGEVTLSGRVSDRRAKRLAEDIADSVSGVREVHNQLRISPPERPEPAEERTQSPPGRPQGDERQRAA